MPVAFPVSIGLVATFCLFTICLAAIFAITSCVSDRKGWPFGRSLIIAGTAFSLLGWSTNHQIRADTQGLGFEHTPDPTLIQAFKHWVSARKDAKAFSSRGTPYPVYLISAEGGGIYAAYHSAMALARWQDSCPSFAQHVFATASVSGGSVGSALFNALTFGKTKNIEDLHCEELAATDGPFQESTKDFFRQDLLTPLVAAGLFPDLLQRVLPYSIDALDRARALEYSFEAGWARLRAGSNLFARNVRETWDHRTASPAMVFVTTETKYGIREFISPFSFNPTTATQSGAYLGSKVDLPVSTAVGLSARFPWITPAGNFSKSPHDIQLADGGYFENSSVDTAHSIVHELRRTFPVSPSGLEQLGRAAGGVVRAALSCNQTNLLEVPLEAAGGSLVICVRLIVLRSFRVPPFQQNAGDLLAPIQALLSSREQRGVLATDMAKLYLCPPPNCGENLSLSDSVLEHRIELDELPLGWVLSRAKKRLIDGYLGDNRRCGLRLGAGKPSATFSRNETRPMNDCVYEAIIGDLKH